MKCTLILSVSTLIMLATATQAAEESTSLMIDAGPCLGITRTVDRLQCLEDRIMAAQGQHSAGNSVVTPPNNLPVIRRPVSMTPAEAPSPAMPRGQEDVPGEQSPALANDSSGDFYDDSTHDFNDDSNDDIDADFGLADEADDEDRRELLGVVAAVRELNPNRKVITLENGQVWEQMETKRFILAEGDEIRIYPSRWGTSYRLASRSHKGFTKVQRVR